MDKIEQRIKQLKSDKQSLIETKNQLIQQLNDIDRTLLRMDGGLFELENLVKIDNHAEQQVNKTT